MITEKDILSALKHVDDPDLKKDIVSLNMVRNIQIEGQNVSFSVYLTTPACPMKDFIQNACMNAIQHFIPEAVVKNIEMTSEIKSGFKKNDALPLVKHIIAVGSGKGGVGKSTVSAGLAIALKNSGAKVGLMDADIYGPSIPILFGVANEGIEMETINGIEMMQPVIKNGIKLFSIGFLSKPEEPIVWRGPMLSSALKQFITGVNWGELDYLIVDLPPGTGDVQITLSQNLPLSGAVVVSTPQNLAVADAKRACAMFKLKSVEVPLLGLVENMSYFSPPELPNNKYRLFGSGGVDALTKEFETIKLGEIPIQMAIGTDSDNGNLENGENMKYFTEIAGRMVQQLAIQNTILN